MLLALTDIRIEDDLRHDPQVKDLIKSMGSIGQITPITVGKNGDGFYVIAGRRRVTAAQELDWTEIEAYIVEDTEARAPLALQVAENVARKDFTPYEYAQGVLALKDETGMTQVDIAEALGIEKSDVSTLQKAARGLAGIDVDKVHQLSFRELQAFAEVHDMPDHMRETFISEVEKDEYPEYVANHYAQEVAKWRWMNHKNQKSLFKMLDDINAVPMDREDRNGAWSLHGDEIDKHAGQPCHGYLVIRTWSNDDGWGVAYFCLDPTSHAPEEGEPVDKDDPLQRVASRAQAQPNAGQGMNQQKAETKRRRKRKQARKEAVADWTIRKSDLRTAVEQTLLYIQREYKWKELGKPFGLTKPKDEYQFDWEPYLAQFAGRDREERMLLLAVASVYIDLESTYAPDGGPSALLLEELDNIFQPELPEE